MLAIDHIVIAAHDPALAAEKFGNEHNVKVIEGGRHENWGTYNHLAYFHNNCYIEWIGVFDRQTAVQSDNPLIGQVVDALDRNMEGAITYALRTEKMDGYVEHFKREGITYTGPIPGSRKRPDGSTLEWRMLFPHSTENYTLPFLIEWGPVKNIPADENLINSQQITRLSTGTAELEGFSSVFQLQFLKEQSQLTNAQIVASNQLAFTID